MTFVPLYRQVADDLRRAITEGRYQPGEKLPTRRDLMKTYGVNGPTVDSAMLVLKTEGYVRGHQGRGTFVADPLPERKADPRS